MPHTHAAPRSTNQSASPAHLKPQLVKSRSAPLTWTLHFGGVGFSGFGLVFSLGFAFGSLPELRNFIVAAACFRMQSLLQ